MKRSTPEIRERTDHEQDYRREAVAKLSAEVRASTNSRFSLDQPQLFAVEGSHTGLFLNTLSGFDDGYDCRTYFEDWRDRRVDLFGFGERGPSDLISEVLRDTRTADPWVKGTVEWQMDGQVVVTCGRHRFNKFTPEDIARLVYLNQRRSDRWHAGTAAPRFYPNCVAPFCKSGEDSPPIEWAAERTAIFGGIASENIGRDIPVYFCEHAFTLTAPLVCNYSKGNHAPRVYTPSVHDKDLLSAAERKVGKVPPEIVALVLDLGGRITPAALNSETFRAYASALPKFIKRGLNIDRVTELVAYHIAGGASPEQALEHGLIITRAVFDSPSRPWWFREDEDLRPAYSRSTQQARELDERLAKAGGPAFTYLRSALAAGSDVLLQSRLEPSEALQFLVTTTNRYGIGNPVRVAKIAQFTAELLSESDQASGRPFSELKRLLTANRPLTEVFGILQGKNASFFLPGNNILQRALDERDRAAGKALDLDLPISGEVKRAALALSEPVTTRALLTLPVSTTRHSQRLLTVSSERPLLPALPLPAPTESNTQLDNRSPLGDWLSFEDRIRAENPHATTSIVQRYFAFCAPRLDNPFNPPKGILTAIERLDDVITPGYAFPALCHPSERERISQNNTRLEVNKFMILSDLLEAKILGLLSPEDVTATIDWLTADLAEWQKREIEIDLIWQHKHAHEHGHYYKAYAVAEVDLEKAREIRRTRILLADLRARTQPDKSMIAYQEVELSRLEREKAENLKSLYAHKPTEFDWDGESGVTDDMASRHSRSGEIREKIKAITVGIGVLKECHKLVVKELLPEEFVNKLWGEMISALKARPHGMKDLEGMADGLRNSVELLAKAASSGLIDATKIHSIAAACSSYSDREAVIRGLKATVDIQEALGVIAEYPYDILGGDKAALRKWVNAVGPILALGSRGIMQSVPFASPEHLARILPALRWIDAYAQVLYEFKHLDPNALPVQSNSYIRSTVNAGTQMIIKAGALHKLVNDIPIDSIEATVNSQIAAVATETLAASTNGVSIVVKPERGVKEIIPDLQRQIGNFRRASFGLPAVGGKAHVLHTNQFDPKRIELVSQVLGLNTNGFHLQHADTTLVLPAASSSGEFCILVAFLDHQGVIDFKEPELQICTIGRLPPKDCATLGASILLATRGGVRYTKDSFVTSDLDHTGFRIMSYDKGGPRVVLPFDLPNAGRTDIMARVHLGDVAPTQLISAMLSYSYLDTPIAREFAGIGNQYRKDLRDILVKWRLDGVLDASWIKVPDEIEDKDAGLRHFNEAVSPCVNAWFDCENALKAGKPGGVVAEVRDLIDRLLDTVRIVQTRLLADSSKFREEKEILGILE